MRNSSNTLQLINNKQTRNHSDCVARSNCSDLPFLTLAVGLGRLLALVPLQGGYEGALNEELSCGGRWEADDVTAAVPTGPGSFPTHFLRVRLESETLLIMPSRHSQEGQSGSAIYIYI